MKEIKAYIRNEKLDLVVNRLANIEGLSGIRVSVLAGCERVRGRLRFLNFETPNKIDTDCQGMFTPVVDQTIEKSIRTGDGGDGKSFLSIIDQSTSVENGASNEV